MSGGHVRNLLLLMKEAIIYTDTLPIPTRALQRSISELRNTYRNTVFANEWQALVKVYHSKQIENDPFYRGLLFNRCILGKVSVAVLQELLAGLIICIDYT